MRNTNKKVTNKSFSIGTVTTIIDIITNIFSAFQSWGDIWRDFRLKRKTKKKYKEAEEALKERDVKKINEIIQR